MSRLGFSCEPIDRFTQRPSVRQLGIGISAVGTGEEHMTWSDQSDEGGGTCRRVSISCRVCPCSAAWYVLTRGLLYTGPSRPFPLDFLSIRMVIMEGIARFVGARFVTWRQSVVQDVPRLDRLAPLICTYLETWKIMKVSFESGA
ncbi:hypothetical protein J6590_011591 [Homalodisca vitripennis]|nr:hypothetical protein J6590_011591 [Homalodisca vitripennis]